MDTLATIARHRQVIATIADAITSVAAGNSLRVIVDGGHPDDITFADHLTQALHARGRDCRCLLPRPGADPAGERMTTRGSAARHPARAVVIDADSSSPDSDAYRIHIRVLSPASDRDDLTFRDGDQPADRGQPHIVVDYLDPEGPTIRHLAPPAQRASR